MSYEIFQPGEVSLPQLSAAAVRHGLTPETPVLMLPYGAGTRIGWETRRLYYALALDASGQFNTRPELRGSSLDDPGKVLPVTRIFSFGECNVACPYCKRDCQFIGDDGVPLVATPVRFEELFGLAEGAHSRGETVRFSGGDPVVFPRETMAIAEYMWEVHRAKVSIAHNGTGPKWVERLLPYLSSAAIDLKGTEERMGEIMGIPILKGSRMFGLSKEVQRLISDAGTCLLDVRTPIFGDTTLEQMFRLAEVVAKNNPRMTFWTWRLYKPVKGCDWSVPEKERTFEMMAKVSAAYPSHWLGVRAKWERGGMVYFLGGKLVNHQDVRPNEEEVEVVGSGNRLAA